MKYSYIKVRKKSIITPEVQLVGIFFGITLFMLFSTYIFLLFKDYRFTQNRLEIKETITYINKEIDSIEEKILFIEEESMLAESIFTKNIVLKDSIVNMFDLVPQRITLSEANLLENGLILYGITPNKDVYNFMLQAPLRSIFHRTYSSFYPAENGWLNFVSTNYIDVEEDLSIDLEEDGYEEEE
ncbi:hypothetical protein JHD48_04540 [Sulfurimonas sp. SAG-AH-194-I05]|nr:hypothetical protein [Sulfurimonas sp. SAG-AH-194-I05]MDF1874998.1 hypothetical protein [Sulfurimonas sp. SAG-AH-194-I05]